MTSKLFMVYHDLAVLLDAGIPILKSLNTVSEGLQGRLRKTFFGISKAISQGNGFADSMAEYPKVFARLDVMLVESAELSGKLPNCFKMLSDWHEFSNRTKKILLSGLMLPVLIFHIMVLIVPLPSMVLGEISIAEYVVRVAKVLGFLYLLIAVTLIIYRSIPRTGLLRVLLDTLTLRMPLMGQAVWQLSICRYCTGFNMLYKAGVPITECVAMAPELTGNLAISSLFKGGKASLASGNMAYEGFSRELPLEYLDLWQIGEQTGELDKMVDKIAEISGDRAEHLLTEFAKWLPRFAYVLVAAMLIVQIFKMAARVYTF